LSFLEVRCPEYRQKTRLKEGSDLSETRLSRKEDRLAPLVRMLREKPGRPIDIERLPRQVSPEREPKAFSKVFTTHQFTPDSLAKDKFSESDKIERVEGTLRGVTTQMENIAVEIARREFSLKHQLLHGSFEADIDRNLASRFNELVLHDGRSYRITITEVRQSDSGMNRCHFLVIPEE